MNLPTQAAYRLRAANCKPANIDRVCALATIKQQALRTSIQSAANHFTFPAAFSSTTFANAPESTVTGSCEQKPRPT